MRVPSGFENNIMLARNSEGMLLPNGEVVSMDGIRTRLNNNVIAMATSGGGKTRSVLTPNLLAGVGSYIVSDPKGNLMNKYGAYMKHLGYDIIHLDFIRPEKSDGYDPLCYVRTPDEIRKLAHYLTYAGKKEFSTADPFWDKCGELLLSAVIAFMVDSEYPAEKMTFGEIGRLLTRIEADKIMDDRKCLFDRDMDDLVRVYKAECGREPWSYQQYLKFRMTPVKTMLTILVTIQSNIGALDTPDVQAMMTKPTIDFRRIGLKKTAVFIEVSDTDRSRDILVNTFYSQAMNMLCTFADEECEDSRLPVPVRFMLDDFGTNCRIEGFENIISNIRSRNISATIILQSESQLVKGYGSSAHTIMDNCDTLIYMGGNDVDTAEMIAKRANRPLSDILDMPVGTNWLFRRGEKPVHSRSVDLDEYSLMPYIYSGKYMAVTERIKQAFTGAKE